MKRTILRRTALAGVALSALLVTAACGGGDDMAGMDHSNSSLSTGASSAANGTFNDADVMFAQMMIPHHQQAVEMAGLAPSRAKDPELKDLAAKIKAAQDPEITTMKGWLTAWGKPTSPPSGHNMPGMSASPGHDMPGMNSDMPGMMSDQEMADLTAAKGTDFDKKFAQMMIAHHNGAIEMAKTEQANGSNPDAKALAAKIAADQAAEVRTLQKILDRL
ncbi:DUF305 domain-containing protein [Micromonospora aurantiaca]|uniref:DUF305 domain-containing protein n=1 Tax=Micromonospora aurantiaca (nom. illeg.) TaxID=47850 RepID=A0A1C6TNJ3_9ACTN|nr:MULTISPECIES: DUF305 domain-containing protein [Micromonospora]AXH93629.1 DUF305 domain-containing protein [Micromonospora aurantiaca]KAB1118674.1 DUF305 domain-containing protein [Micromonospora aurantiaca]MBC8992552.1 DUF305 domain-containing protein [Micromonospora chalcea]MCT2280408.1 DUF305 domain-containing protein [Micromonospora chalcea]MDG4752765.1 DUF305 domain-containing protein [Micromonospora sp. WMMD718]